MYFSTLNIASKFEEKKFIVYEQIIKRSRDINVLLEYSIILYSYKFIMGIDGISGNSMEFLASMEFLVSLASNFFFVIFVFSVKKYIECALSRFCLQNATPYCPRHRLYNDDLCMICACRYLHFTPHHHVDLIFSSAIQVHEPCIYGKLSIGFYWFFSIKQPIDRFC